MPPRGPRSVGRRPTAGSCGRGSTYPPAARGRRHPLEHGGQVAEHIQMILIGLVTDAPDGPPPVRECLTTCCANPAGRTSASWSTGDRLRDDRLVQPGAVPAPRAGLRGRRGRGPGGSSGGWAAEAGSVGGVEIQPRDSAPPGAALSDAAVRARFRLRHRPDIRARRRNLSSRSPTSRASSFPASAPAASTFSASGSPTQRGARRWLSGRCCTGVDTAAIAPAAA